MEKKRKKEKIHVHTSKVFVRKKQMFLFCAIIVNFACLRLIDFKKERKERKKKETCFYRELQMFFCFCVIVDFTCLRRWFRCVLLLTLKIIDFCRRTDGLLNTEGGNAWAQTFFSLFWKYSSFFNRFFVIIYFCFLKKEKDGENFPPLFSVFFEWFFSVFFFILLLWFCRVLPREVRSFER